MHTRTRQIQGPTCVSHVLDDLAKSPEGHGPQRSHDSAPDFRSERRTSAQVRHGSASVQGRSSSVDCDRVEDDVGQNGSWYNPRSCVSLGIFSVCCCCFGAGDRQGIFCRGFVLAETDRLSSGPRGRSFRSVRHSTVLHVTTGRLKKRLKNAVFSMSSCSVVTLCDNDA